MEMKTTEQKEPSKLKVIIPWLGWVGFLFCIGLFCVTGCSQNTMMNEQASSYQQAKSKALTQAATLTGSEAEIALDRFGKFLKSIGSEEYIEKEIANVYAENAYLNDTLKTMANREEIRQHFIKTSKTMTTYSLEVEDTVKSDQGYYVRWTMKFSAPKLAGGEELVSIGMSHVIFDSEGKVLLHQDFWDSTTGLFEHIPVLGGGIRMVKKRL
jgi:hypothetical protein